MNYCEFCGAANDILSSQCHRCGHDLPAMDEAQAVAFAAQRSSPAQAVSDTPAAEVGNGLELPEWLKRAAAQTPPAVDATPVPTSDTPPPGFVVAAHDVVAGDDKVVKSTTAHPLPPVPAGDLPSAMPDWLKTRSHDLPAAEQPAPPMVDVADTSSFISETDLPDWIRQIAAADAAKLADQERAREAATQVAHQVPVRQNIPSEQPPSSQVANPWLARREGGPAAQSWTGSSATPVAPAPMAAESQPVLAYDQPAATKSKTAPATRGFKMPSFSLPALSKGGAGGEEASVQRRLLLAVAAALLLLIVLFGVIL